MTQNFSLNNLVELTENLQLETNAFIKFNIYFCDTLVNVLNYEIMGLNGAFSRCSLKRSLFESLG